MSLLFFRCNLFSFPVHNIGLAGTDSSVGGLFSISLVRSLEERHMIAWQGVACFQCLKAGRSHWEKASTWWRADPPGVVPRALPGNPSCLSRALEPVIPLDTPFPSPPHPPPPATLPGSPGTGVLNMELGVSGPLHAGQVPQLKDLKFTNILVERELWYRQRSLP